MPTKGDRRLAVLVHTAPLLGVVIWVVCVSLGGDGWNLLIYFASGMFMAATSLLVAVLVRLRTKAPFVRGHARVSLWFHGIIMMLMLLLSIALLAAWIWLDPRQPTLNNPPTHSQGVFILWMVLSSIVLPPVELIWAVVGIIRALRSRRVLMPAQG